MKRWTLAALFPLLITTLLSGCGGGSSEDASVGTTGIAVDPYISEARFQEILEDGSPGQLSSLSDELGRFRFETPLAEGSRVVMVERGVHNGLPYEGELRSCAEFFDGELVVSPFTTVLANLIETGMNEEEAKEELLAMLETAGIELEAADLTLDPMAGVGWGPGLGRIRGTMAVNGWLQAMDAVDEDGFAVTDPEGYLAHLQERQQLLSEMASAMEAFLGEGNIDALRETLTKGLPEDYPLDIDDMIRAASTTCGGLADRAFFDGEGNLRTPPVEVGSFEEAFIRHYAGRNMANSEFALWYKGSDLPEFPSEVGFTMEEILEEMGFGNMMGAWNQDGSWGMRR